MAAATIGNGGDGEAFVYVERCKGINNLDKVVLRERNGASAEIYLHGAHVTSWKNKHGKELLFVSRKASFHPSSAIRGGISICFPQYKSGKASKPAPGIGHFVGLSVPVPVEDHGFARHRFWSIEENPPLYRISSKYPCKAFIDLIMNQPEKYSESFQFRVRVGLGSEGELVLTPRVRNLQGKQFEFTFAYQTYLSVCDVSEVRIEGLETLNYIENLDEKKECCTEQESSITFESEIDRSYLSTPEKIAVIDHMKKKTIVLVKHGLPDLVLWNPWSKMCKAMPDMDKNDYENMLVIGAASIDPPIVLKAGEEWTGEQVLLFVQSSYCSGQLDPKKVVEGR